ncbi:MAG TPA: hypothetical protein VG318_17450 [Actinomycetota bacterium]|nr:hypothetical protein [Actinomycetota bacterium]
MPAHHVTLFLSTGRCGTQWLAHNLSEFYQGKVWVTHEPIGPHYRPRELLRAPEATPAPEVTAHLDEVAQALEGRDYVETGWPLFAAIPLFVRRFPGRVRVVHLTRHPVRAALSHMVHQCYAGSPRADDYTRLAALGPEDPGVLQRAYAERWGALTPFEKCLYWCTEVHLYAREIEGAVPVLRLRAEDVLAGDEVALRRLCDFAGLPYEPQLTERSRRRVDAWHHRTRLDLDWRRVFEHPAALEVVEWLGYGFEELDDEELRERYEGAPFAGGDKEEEQRRGG